MFYLVHDGEQVATGPCPRCDGKGSRGVDRWTKITIEGREPYLVNFGHLRICARCSGSGRVVTARYTRGRSLVPLAG